MPSVRNEQALYVGGIKRVDLKIRYNNENDEIKSREYNTIMDFIDEMESDEIDIPMLGYDMVEATFFEKRKEYFVTIADLLEHYKQITR